MSVSQQRQRLALAVLLLAVAVGCGRTAAEAAAAAAPALATTTTTTAVDNTKPRTDESGAIVNAHQGHIARFQQPDGSWRYYWVGSAWAPCEPEGPAGAHPGKCTDGQPVVDGECLEPKENGCLSMTYGACGFNNNNISVYSSATLSNADWRVETHDALPRATRAVGEYWQPNFDYNPTTKLYVMWWIYSVPNTTFGVVQVGTAPTPGGPYKIANANVTLNYKSFTSANLFVDRPMDGASAAAAAAPAAAAYVIYSSFQPGGGPQAVVERLDETWTKSTLQASKPVGSGEGEVMFRWDSAAAAGTTETSYYILAGTGCCFCPTGADVVAWKAEHPTGPYTQVRNINPPYPAPAGSHVLAIGKKACVSANASSACVPDGGVLPGSGVQCAVRVTPCTGAAEQQWRLTAVGEIQSNLTSTPEHTMCLDGCLGGAGQEVYTNFRQYPGNPAHGQLWTWNTTGAASALALTYGGNCVSVSTAAATEGRLTLSACSDETTVWSFPPSTPEIGPPVPPPGEKCHGCQDNCCVVPRKWELPCQQQGVTSMGSSKLAQPPAGCEGGAILWSGDAWQQAPDDRKQHDPQWWVPLCFDKGGEIQNLTAMKQWHLQ